MRRTTKAINNLSLRKNIIRKARIQSSIKHLWASRAQNDVLEATVTARRPTVLMSIPCAEWCAWSNTVTARRPTVLMSIPCAEWCAWSNSHSAQAHSTYEHPVRRMMCLKQQSQRSGVRIEKFKAQRKEILMHSVLNLCDSLFNLFF